MNDQPSPPARTADLPRAAGAVPLNDGTRGVTRRAMVARSGFAVAALALDAGACGGRSEGASRTQPGALAGGAPGGIDPMSRNPLAEPLVRIGDAIARGDDAALDAYFAPGFVLHTPQGDLSYDQLTAYWASLRAAFPDLAVRRAAVLGEGNYLASRTIFSGTFTHALALPPASPRQPNGRRVEWELINFFRYTAEGRLAEEWLQYDVAALDRQLGAA